MIEAKFYGDKIISSSPQAFTLYEKSRFGEKKSGKVEYSGVEALFLLSTNKAKVLSGKKSISEETLLRKLKRKDKKLETKFAVFRDLRKKRLHLKNSTKIWS